MVAAEPVLASRCDLGLRLRRARPRRAHADHDGDDARLLRAAAREDGVHARDAARLDHTRGVRRASRSETVAGGAMSQSSAVPGKPGPRADLEQRIEAVENGYEFLLAYAAQGRDTDKGAAAGRNVRDYLERMATALDGLGGVIGACAASVDPKLTTTAAAFFTAVDADARVALGALRLVL